MVKGVKKVLAAAALFQQNDLPIHQSVTSSFTTLSASPSAGLKTGPGRTTHNIRHRCSSLHNLIISRQEWNTFSKLSEQKSFSLKANMIFLHIFPLSSKNNLRCIVLIILTIIFQWMSIYKFINFFETNHWHPNLLIPMKDSLSRYNCSCPTLPVTVSYTS